MLSQLNENRPILLESAEGTFRASQMAGFQFLGIVWFVVAAERLAVAIVFISKIVKLSQYTPTL